MTAKLGASRSFSTNRHSKQPAGGSGAGSACRNFSWRLPGPTAIPAATSATAASCCGSPSSRNSRLGSPRSISAGSCRTWPTSSSWRDSSPSSGYGGTSVGAERLGLQDGHQLPLIGTDQYEQVAPGGELKHGTLGNETYTNKADTYGLMLSVDRRDVINDDLGPSPRCPASSAAARA